MCVPPQDKSDADFAREKAKLDSLRGVRCPRLMSSAAEYYRNRDWKQTVKIYEEITTLDCDEWNSVFAPPQEIYQYYAIAYEQMGKFDSSEFVLLDGLQKLPDNIVRRQDSPMVLNHVASMYLFKSEYIRKSPSLFAGSVLGYKIPYERSFDIDSEVDKELVEYFYKNLNTDFGEILI